jgi:LmbE family N-acetylglucosaminyl deacetylase
LLVLAPHPDDEALGTGGLLQAAALLGVPVRVVFATNGERNPWAQRAVERRLWLDRNAEAIVTLAEHEGLDGHAETVRLRLER